MPLSRATIAAVGIFTFVISWNNFIWPFVVTSAGSLFTIPVGLANVQTSYGALYAQQMALAVLGALPLLIVVRAVPAPDRAGRSRTPASRAEG